MPAASPQLAAPVTARLAALGVTLRARRKQFRINATTMAEAAGMSRVTLHRIERGEASVTMGAYLNAMVALGMGFELTAPEDSPQTSQASAVPHAQPTGLPAPIRLADYPQLRQLAWHLPGVVELPPETAFSLYERNWRHVDRAHLEPAEQALIDRLVATLGKGHLLV